MLAGNVTDILYWARSTLKLTDQHYFSDHDCNNYLISPDTGAQYYVHYSSLVHVMSGTQTIIVSSV